MAVWPFLMAAAGTLLAASIWVGDKWSAHVSGIILVAYMAVQAKKVTFGDTDMAFVATAAIWIVAAVAIQRQVGENQTQSRTKVTAVRTLLTLSGSCYLWARVVDAPRTFGSTPYVSADLLLIVAMLIIGSGLSANLLRRNGNMGSAWQFGHSDSHRRDIDRVYPLPDNQAEQEAVKRGRHG